MATSKVYGYPQNDGRELADFQGKVIGRGHVLNKTRIRPGARGAWISSERVSYRFKIDGKWYGCRGMGDGISASCRVLKRQPAGLGGARRRR